MPIRFTCSCGQQLQTAEEHAGRTVRCPTCGKDNTVPDLLQAVLPVEAVLPSPNPPEAVETDERHIKPAPTVRPRSRDRNHAWDDDEADERPVPAQGTSGKAIAALVLGLMSFCAVIFTGIPAIIFGILGLNDISKSRGRLKGKGMAITGIVLGALGGLVIGPIAMLIGLLVPAVEKVREAAARIQSSNNLKQMAIAMHNYNDTIDHLPENAAISGPDGKPLLSWRVALLPYLEQGSLFKQFHLDEPWDSPHNKTLIPLMPKVYVVPAADPKVAQQGLTYYRVFVGPGTAFRLRGDKPPRIPDSIPDGTSNTIMIVEAAEAVPWTKPDELVYDPTGPLPPLGGHLRPGYCNVVMFDGSTRIVHLPGVSESTLRHAITANDGQPLGADWP